MKRNETRHSAANNNEAKAMSFVDASSPERAKDYARNLYDMRVRGWGSKTRALDDVADWSGMTPRSYERLMRGETKEPGETVFFRVRAAYLNYCHLLVRRLQKQIEIEEEKHGHAALEDIGAEVSALVEKIVHAKKRMPK